MLKDAMGADIKPGDQVLYFSPRYGFRKAKIVRFILEEKGYRIVATPSAPQGGRRFYSMTNISMRDTNRLIKYSA